MTDDGIPEESHALARQWLDAMNLDVVTREDHTIAHHATSLLIVMLIAQWIRSQPCAKKAHFVMRHVAYLVLEGFSVGCELWNEDHADEGELVVAPAQPQVRMPLHRAPRRRPPRVRPC